VRERCSFSTRENARFTAGVLLRRGVAAAAVVTCGWHMPRAVALFARAGVVAEPVESSQTADLSWPARWWRCGLERVLSWV
jgi:uncharacterized SAM-binding protein YcdF (DUF218 family)